MKTKPPWDTWDIETILLETVHMRSPREMLRLCLECSRHVLDYCVFRESRLIVRELDRTALHRRRYEHVREIARDLGDRIGSLENHLADSAVYGIGFIPGECDPRDLGWLAAAEALGWDKTRQFRGFADALPIYDFTPSQASMYNRSLDRQAEYALDIWGYADLRTNDMAEFSRGKHLLTDAREVARGMFTENRFDDMDVLADALKETGLNLPGAIAHAENKRRHIRGCWLIRWLCGGH